MRVIAKHIIYTYLCFCYSIGLLGQKVLPTGILTKQTVFEAGDSVVLEFAITDTAYLFCHSSYGSAIVVGYEALGVTKYTLPKFLTAKKGVIDYKLVSNRKQIFEGSIYISASSNANRQLESYIGPPSISAGGNDYTMLVVIPTDSLDNPVEEKTPVKISHQFLENQVTSVQQTSHFIAWKNIYSYPTSGRLLVASSVSEIASKEFSIEVFPAQPTNFTINYFRKHTYADGNQLTTFASSIIKDKYNNIISDGTLVDFVIKKANGVVLKAQGSSIRGIASAKVMHPSEPTSWEVSAYVSGMAVSNTVTVNYKPVTNNLPVTFTEGNRNITVGPLKSFMGQLIPDGALVELFIVKGEALVEKKLATTSEGRVNFKLEDGAYSSGKYSFEIRTLGLKANFQNIKL